MEWERFVASALALGFDRAFSVTVDPFERWERVTATDRDPRWSKLCADPTAVMPGARAIVVLVKGYRPYMPAASGEASVHAYYPTSNEVHAAARCVAELLRENGYRADFAPAIPAKPSLLRTGEAFYGKNGLLAIPPFGTRVRIQTILTDAPFPTVDRTPLQEIDPLCDGCGLCAAACPVGALDGTSRVSTQKCLRAQSYVEPMPERFRPLLGSCLLGCDLCQSVCPRNSGICAVPAPAALRDALRMERLLSGDVKPLAAVIGSNYARAQQVRGRAALLAGNLGRTDCVPLLRELTASEFTYVREHAEWSLRRLEAL